MQPEQRHYIESSHFSERTRRMWDPIGPADEMLTLDLADYLKLDGMLPDNSGPRSTLFNIPSRSSGTRGGVVNTALEIHIPAEDLGSLAHRRWREFTAPNDHRVIGAEIVRTLAHSDRSFWEIPTILRGNQMFPSNDPVAEGFIAVTTVPGKSFEHARLSFVFYYDSAKAIFAHAQIDSWLSEMSRYLVQRGLADSLVAMVGEGASFGELLRHGKRDLPLPSVATHADSFEELIPESLVRKGTFHGRHPQLQFDRFMSQVRVPTHPDLSPDFAPLVNQSTLVRELMRNGFAVSWCDGVIDAMPRPSSNEPQSLADILPPWIGLEHMSFNSTTPPPNSYWGPYLHIVAEHPDEPAARLDAASGTLLLLYRFKDYITGLEKLRSV